VETVLNEQIKQAEMNIDGYAIYREDRCKFKEGKASCVILYIKNEILSYECNDLSSSETESVWCKLKIGNTNSMIVGVCYRSQATSEVLNMNWRSSLELSRRHQKDRH